jgi:hypothetical protein
MELQWEAELRDEILPCNGAAMEYGPWWLECDNWENPAIDKRQWMHAVLLDPGFECQTEDGRLFAGSPRFELVARKINEGFWSRFDAEIHNELTPSFLKVAEAVAMIQANMLVLNESYEAAVDVAALERRIHRGDFEYDDADALLELLGSAADAKKKMHLRFRGVYETVMRAIVDKRNGIFRRAAANLSKGGIAYFRAKFDGGLDLTAAWLRRAQRHREREGLEVLFARAVVSLLENAPALVHIFPETFALDKREFLRLYNELNGLVDAKIATLFAEAWRCVKRNTRPSCALRLILMGRLLVYCEEQVLSALGPLPRSITDDNMHAPFEMMPCGDSEARMAAFVGRLCRVASVNFAIHGQRYLAMHGHFGKKN